MAEETVWRGRSSQLKNLRAFIMCGLMVIGIMVVSFAVGRMESPAARSAAPLVLLALLFPLVIAVARYLRTKSKLYELTTERLKTTEGVFSKVTDTLELYRVKDLETRQPFFARVFGLENVQLNTSDTNTPFILIDAVPSSLGLGDKVRNNVEAVRMAKRVREIDVQ